MNYLCFIFLFSFCLNSEWLYFSDQDRLQYFSNYNINEKNYNISKLIIAIQGNGRSAGSIYNYILDAAELTDSKTNSLIISPWFKGNRSVLADVALTPEAPPTRVSIAN